MERDFEKSRVNFISKTMLTMGIGLLVTFMTAIFSAKFLMPFISFQVMIVAMVLEVILVIYLGARIEKMSVVQANVAFYTYAIVNGFTLSIIFSQYDLGFLSIVFIITSAMFFSSSMIGITTKKDLTTLGNFFVMMLIGLLILTLVQVIFRIQAMSFAISLIGIIIFCGLTAYDMQKVKMIHQQAYSFSPEETAKYSVMAALQLYLDFINIFIYLLRLLKDR